MRLAEDEVVYPCSDGEPLADNTLQFEWIMTLKGNLDLISPDFVAGDLLWYPVQGDPKTRVAPDVLVAPGRPKGHRSSYLQWKEAGVVPKMVFEVMIPGNTVAEMMRKHGFYQHFGVDEFYLLDPDKPSLAIYRRERGFFELAPDPLSYRSRHTGIRFAMTADGLQAFGPDDTPFRAFAELAGEAKLARAEADEARNEAESARNEAESARNEAESARNEAESAKAAASTERARADALSKELAELRQKLAQF